MRTIAEMKRDSIHYEEMRDGNGELYAYDFDNYINDVFNGTEDVFTHDAEARILAEELIDNGTDWNEARKFFYVENNNSFLTDEGEKELARLNNKKTDVRDRDITIAEVTAEFLKDKRESVFVDETTGEEPEIVVGEKQAMEDFKAICKENNYKWNGRVYGSERWGHYVFFNTIKTPITDEEARAAKTLDRRELDTLISYRRDKAISSTNDYTEASGFHGATAEEFGMPKTLAM
jgi:hypothetical protein